MNPSKKSTIKRLGALAALFASVSAHATSLLVWQGNFNTNLLAPENWVGGIAPAVTILSGQSNAVQFGVAGAAGGEITNEAILNFGYTGSTPAINFIDGASAYTFTGSGTIGMATGAITNASRATQTFNCAVRFNTGNTYRLTNPNSALVFGGRIELNAATAAFALGSSTGQSLTFGNDFVLGSVSPTDPKNLHLDGSSSAAVVTLNGTTNPGLTGNLRIGSNVRVLVGSATGLSEADAVIFHGGNASLANNSLAPLVSPASLSFNAASQNYSFGSAGQTSAQNITLAGTTPFTADLTRTLTLNGTGLTYSNGAVWNNSATGNRTLSVNQGGGSSGNTFGIGGLGIGAAAETGAVTLTLNGSGNIAVSGGILLGGGTGTRSLQVNTNSVLTINGASNYDGTTGIGSSASVLMNGTHTGGSTYTVAGNLGGTGVIDFGARTAAINFTGTASNTRRLTASSVDGLTITGGNATLNLTNAAGRTDGLKSFYFTLGAPGGTVVDTQGLLNLGASTLNFDDFVFTTGSGFRAGVYRLFDYVSSSGTLGEMLTGTIDGLDATISQDAANSAIILTVTSSQTADTTPPVITLTGASSVSVPWGTAYVDAGATATDDVDSVVAVSTANPVNTALPGVYTVTYTASDLAGNAALPVTRTVSVSIANATTAGADGLSPLMKYAFGANGPADPVQTPVLSSTSTTLSITAVVRTNDVNLVVGAETNTDLALPGNWTTTGVSVANAADQSNLPANTVRRVYSVNHAGSSRKFLRLVISNL